MTTHPLILASGSKIRAQILSNAGVFFDIQASSVDEALIKSEAADEGLTLEETAQKLADEKCLDIALKRDGFVIGSDQILEFRDRGFDKPTSMEEAGERLRVLSGQEHSLINATALALNGQIIWRHIERPRLTMRPLTRREIDLYLAGAGEDILSSVGAYQMEGLGARLFEKIDGEYYAILGLSLLPLLGELRKHGAVPF